MLGFAPDNVAFSDISEDKVDRREARDNAECSVWLRLEDHEPIVNGRVTERVPVFLVRD